MTTVRERIFQTSDLTLTGRRDYILAYLMLDNALSRPRPERHAADKETALRLGPVSHQWLAGYCAACQPPWSICVSTANSRKRSPAGADPLHLTEVFGIGQNTALRYAHAARQLLQGSIEEHHIDHREHPQPR